MPLSQSHQILGTPLKEGGYNFTCVCLSVCLSARLLKKLWTNFDFLGTGRGPRTNRLHFADKTQSGHELDQDFLKDSLLTEHCNSYRHQNKNKTWKFSAEVWTLRVFSCSFILLHKRDWQITIICRPTSNRYSEFRNRTSYFVNTLPTTRVLTTYSVRQKKYPLKLFAIF